MLIDNVVIKVVAGKGGDGAVAFSHVKMTLGPTGAHGGRGGDVYFEAVSDLGALRRFRARKVFVAENGQHGRSSFRDGHEGKDLILTVPRGTVVHNTTAGTEHELTKLGERLLVARGGRGGKGNFHYKSSRNTSPKQFQHGLPGEEWGLQLELKLIADIGLVGFPNIGKSSFLNTVTNAESRVANYPFTTLEPNLGVYQALVLADIPGLIEGASSGKGLGIKFLRHIERTRILFHFIDAATKDPLADYKTLRNELKLYNPLLLKKPEYIILSRSDMISADQIKKTIKILSSQKKEIFVLSLYDDTLIATVTKLLSRIMKDIEVVPDSIEHSK